MDAKFIGKKTSKDQSIEQALRRLKYLHTSLMPHEGSTRQNGHKLNERTLWTKELKPPRQEEQLTRARRTPEKHYFLSLQPKTPSMSREKIKTRVVKRKQEKKGVRTGRAPLQAYRVTSSLSSVTAQEILRSKRDNMINSREINPACEERISRSASEVFCANDPHKCIQCLRKDIDENANKPHRQKPTKEYLTNMRINRVTFSARPSGYKVKSVRESKSKIEVHKSCFFNGWGVRLSKESLPQGEDTNINNNLKRNVGKKTMEVTVGLKTLTLEPKRMQKEQTEPTIPQPPPTPVRQIDIKLPQGLMVRYQLSEDD